MYKSGFSGGSLGQQKVGTRGKERQNQSVVGWRGERTTLFDLLDLAMPEA